MRDQVNIKASSVETQFCTQKAPDVILMAHGQYNNLVRLSVNGQEVTVNARALVDGVMDVAVPFGD